MQVRKLLTYTTSTLQLTSLLSLKQAGGWNSDSVAQEYVDVSIPSKLSVADALCGKTSSVSADCDEDVAKKRPKTTASPQPNSNPYYFNFNSSSNCNVTLVMSPQMPYYGSVHIPAPVSASSENANKSVD
jgi:hypothetical protein